MINIKRKYIPIIQLLETEEVEEVIKHSSKVIASFIQALLNNKLVISSPASDSDLGLRAP